MSSNTELGWSENHIAESTGVFWVDGGGIEHEREERGGRRRRKEGDESKGEAEGNEENEAEADEEGDGGEGAGGGGGAPQRSWGAEEDAALGAAGGWEDGEGQEALSGEREGLDGLAPQRDDPTTTADEPSRRIRVGAQRQRQRRWSMGIRGGRASWDYLARKRDHLQEKQSEG